jgi:CheY-like chemotaxis protein/HPt (histidine-containing phosphotransfer) domain-containing protein
LSSAAARGEPYQLVLLDCMMPVMDGFEFAERVRADEQIRDTQIIMVSSAAQPGHGERCRRLNIVRYMTKPVVQSELLNTIQDSACGDFLEKPRRAVEEPVSSPAARRLKVLLAEDGLINQQVAVGMLKMQGHNVVIAADGRAAVDRWKNDQFDVVLMDVQMPEMDGYEATAAIRELEREAGRRTPIIAMTANAMKGDREKCLAADMDGYVAKPIEREQLFEAINEIALASSGDGEAAGAGTSPAAAQERKPSESAGPIVDFQAAEHRVPGGADGVRSLAKVMLDECPKLLGEMKSALADGDATRLQRAAHTLKGSADVFAARRLVNACWTVESQANERDLKRAETALAEVESEVAAFVRIVENLL